MLIESLQICLLALMCRYPQCVVEINKEMFADLAAQIDVTSATDILVLLEIYAPHLLDTSACLIANEQKGEIYLVEQSQTLPAFRISLKGSSSERHSNHAIVALAQARNSGGKHATSMGHN